MIVGLGNPGKEYENTRHNVGFMAVDAIAGAGATWKNEKNALTTRADVARRTAILAKPQTFMNLSGEAVIEFVNFFKIPEENLLVIYDDFDTEPGKIRIRKFGTAGSHNGMISIIENLKTEKFPRIRIGIGKPKDKNIDMISHVIGFVSDEDKKVLKEGVKRGAEAVSEMMKNGIDSAMNKYN